MRNKQIQNSEYAYQLDSKVMKHRKPQFSIIGRGKPQQSSFETDEVKNNNKTKHNTLLIQKDSDESHLIIFGVNIGQFST